MSDTTDQAAEKPEDDNSDADADALAAEWEAMTDGEGDAVSYTHLTLPTIYSV